MKLAHNIGDIIHPNYNTAEQILACQEPIGFDGIYLNVFEQRHLLKGKTGILFVMGDYFGEDNRFDLANVPKLEKYCTWEQVYYLAKETGFEIGWHTWSHRDLTTLTRDEIRKEIAPPPYSMDGKPIFESFAYPYGRYNDLVVHCVKEAGYKRAYSVTQGSTNPADPDHQYKIFRDYIR